MDEERKIIFANYISHLCLSNKTTGCIGKYVRHIKIFLDSGYELTRKGYESYKKNNAEIHCGNSAKEAILDLLHFLGVGYRRKEDGKVLKPHRKLNMLLALSYYVTVNRKAMQEEVQKMKRRYGNKTK